ncbi:MAG: hypothetical protein E7486_01250 [Ruminococcaceae bacterium]|nr:hypothetical protein [Oscillospiraceae bacterium]
MTNLKQKMIVFAGDSITDSGRNHDAPICPGMMLGNGYVKLLDDYWKNSLGENAPILINAGYGGFTSLQLAERFSEDVDAFHPDILVMLIGVNDQYSKEHGNENCTVENYRVQLDKMLTGYGDNYDKVVAMTPFYVEALEGSSRRADLIPYQEALKEEAAKHANLTLIDLQALWDREIAKPDYVEAEFTADRVHLLPKAAALVRDELLKVISL